MTRTLTATLLVSFAALSACDDGPKTDPSVAAADKIFTERCANCHGPGGAGDGPGAAALDPKPRSFTSLEWQTSVDDARIRKVVVGGGKAVGLSEAMAPNPDLASKPNVLSALVLKIRHMKK